MRVKQFNMKHRKPNRRPINLRKAKFGEIIGAAGSIAGLVPGGQALGIGLNILGTGVGMIEQKQEDARQKAEENRRSQIAEASARLEQNANQYDRNLPTFSMGGYLPVFANGGTVDPQQIAAMQQAQQLQGQGQPPPQGLPPQGIGQQQQQEVQDSPINEAQQQQGIDSIQGQTHENGGTNVGNVVEAEKGETKEENVIFSDRLKITASDVKEYDLPKGYKGKSLSEVSKMIDKQFSLRRSDKIDLKERKRRMDILVEIQEDKKQSKDNKEFKDEQEQSLNSREEETQSPENSKLAQSLEQQKQGGINTQQDAQGLAQQQVNPNQQQLPPQDPSQLPPQLQQGGQSGGLPQFMYGGLFSRFGLPKVGYGDGNILKDKERNGANPINVPVHNTLPSVNSPTINAMNNSRYNKLVNSFPDATGEGLENLKRFAYNGTKATDYNSIEFPSKSNKRANYTISSGYAGGDNSTSVNDSSLNDNSVTLNNADVKVTNSTELNTGSKRQNNSINSNGIPTLIKRATQKESTNTGYNLDVNNFTPSTLNPEIIPNIKEPNLSIKEPNINIPNSGITEGDQPKYKRDVINKAAGAIGNTAFNIGSKTKNAPSRISNGISNLRDKFKKDDTPSDGIDLKYDSPSQLYSNTGNLYNIGRGIVNLTKKDKDFTRLTPQYATASYNSADRALNDVNTAANTASNTIRNTSTGTGNYLSNIIALRSRQGEQRASTNQSYDEANNKIYNRLQEVNASIGNTTQARNSAIEQYEEKVRQQEKDIASNMIESGLRGVGDRYVSGKNESNAYKVNMAGLQMTGTENWKWVQDKKGNWKRMFIGRDKNKPSAKG